MKKISVEINCPTCGGVAHVDVVKGKEGHKDYTGVCRNCENRVIGKFNGKGFENVVAVEINCPTCGGEVNVIEDKEGYKDYTGVCKHCENRVTGKFNGKSFENVVAE